MKKRKFLLYILCLFIFNICRGQDYKYIYYLDVNLYTIEKSKAVILGRGLKENGLFRLDCFSVNGNIFLMTFHFTDSTLVNIQGPFRSYHRNGKIEKEGNYVNGNEEGAWQEWDTLGLKVDSTIYKNGLPYIQATYRYWKNGGLSYYSFKDSLQNIFRSTSYNEQAIVNSEVFFTGQKGFLKTYTKEGVKVDSLYTREEKEASFPGGDEGWRNYLKRNLNPNTPVNNGASSGLYKVVIKFIVTKDGTLTDVYAETNYGYGMEVEAIRVIKKGPKWIPAVQYGRKVNAYRRQPVTFLVDGG